MSTQRIATMKDGHDHRRQARIPALDRMPAMESPGRPEGCDVCKRKSLKLFFFSTIILCPAPSHQHRFVCVNKILLNEIKKEKKLVECEGTSVRSKKWEKVMSCVVVECLLRPAFHHNRQLINSLRGYALTSFTSVSGLNWRDFFFQTSNVIEVKTICILHR